MRKFSSYGLIDKDLNYYVPRQELIDFAHLQLLGEKSDKNGHYITVWAPRQRGKSWVMQQVLWRLQKDERFEVLKLNLEHLKMETDVNSIVQSIAEEIIESLKIENVRANSLKEFYNIFKQGVMKRPLILILDEFDALAQDAISGIAGVFRNIHNHRREDQRPTDKKQYLLHGVALIGVRAVLGVENVTGSPFNVQRSLHIPNLTAAEVQEMFACYQRESRQVVQPEVVKRLFYELQGQPGLVSWFGELLTETYNSTPNSPLTMHHFDEVFGAATHVLPNNNILNIISKSKQEPYRFKLFELFKTAKKVPFSYDDPDLNFLYLNGVIDWEKEGVNEYYVKFPCPFVQKRLFNYFTRELFPNLDKLYGPFEDLTDIITENQLNVKNLLKRYEQYLKENRAWLLRDAPRRTTDLRIYEAVYHFNLYMYLKGFFKLKGGQVQPEFPTGNGKIDLLITYAGQLHGIEVKSFTDKRGYHIALTQAARYGQQLKLLEITLALFVEQVDDTNRQKYEVVYQDEETGVTVIPVFVETGGIVDS